MTLAPPFFPALPVQDLAAHLPVQQDQFATYRERRPQLRCANPAPQVGEKPSIAVRSNLFYHSYAESLILAESSAVRELSLRSAVQHLIHKCSRPLPS